MDNDKMDVDTSNTDLIDNSLVIQHDWHACIKDNFSSFFIGFKNLNEAKTYFFDVKTTKLIDDIGFVVLPSNENCNFINTDDISIKLDMLNSLHITYNGRTTIFVPPVAELKISGLSSAPQSLCISKSGLMMLSTDLSGNFVLSNSMDGSTLRTLEGHLMDVTCCRFFPSDLVILSGGMDMSVRVWAADSGKCVRTLKGHKDRVTNLAIIDIGKEVLSCSNDGSVIKWNCSTSSIVKQWMLGAGRCTSMVISNDNTTVAVVCDSGKLFIIDLVNNDIVSEISIAKDPNCVCFGQNSSKMDEKAQNVFIGFENGLVSCYNIENKNVVAEMKTNRGRINLIRHEFDRLLIAFNDGVIGAYQLTNFSKQHLTESGDFNQNVIPEFELTGADCDPIYDLTINGRDVYTCCRDKIIRKYSILWNTQ